VSARAVTQEEPLLPIIASALVGIVAKAGIGLMASAAKHVWDRANAGSRAERFADLLGPPAPGPARPARAPVDVAARIAVELARIDRAPESP
jgi:hypothetical protein